MKCPYCGYIHGWDGESLSAVEGKDGGFFELPIQMTRPSDEYRGVAVTLYACPSCSKTFVDY